ncbi:MAG: hypothetical protein GY946_17890 [bacterium]|nr:hypothetical protein [bacterium]
MARPRIEARNALRSRRWDVLILGSALPGLVVGIRLAMAGHRVLVAEEDTTARTPLLFREPFTVPGVLGNGLVDQALRALGIPSIERRRFTPGEVAYQVLLPEARLDVGDRDLTARELVAWGLAKPEEARALTHELERSAAALGQGLLEAAFVKRSSRLAPLSRETPAGAGLPTGVHTADGELAAYFSLQSRGLCELPEGEPGPEATTRLLGATLAGGTGHSTGETGLLGALRERLENLHAEFRTIGCPFEFVELGGHPGILRSGPGDAWFGRALVINTIGGALTTALEGWGKPVPGFLGGARPAFRRCAVHFRALREVVPEPLAPRALLPAPESGPITSPIRLSLHPSPRGKRFAELVAAATIPADADPEPVAEALEAEIRTLMPFSERRLKAGPLAPTPGWDDPMGQPGQSPSWPSAVTVRTRSREPVFTLPREEVASLGLEGELLLGWRAGDAIREELG